MTAKNALHIAMLFLFASIQAFANQHWFYKCKKECESCQTGCTIKTDTYCVWQDKKKNNGKSSASDAENAAKDECNVNATNYSGGGGNAPSDTSPGFTSLNFRREGLIFTGVGPDYVKYETIEETTNGVTISVKKPIQLPVEGATIFYTDLLDDQDKIIGYQSTEYKNSQLSAPNAQGLRSIPAGAQPVSITTFRHPVITAETDMNIWESTLDVIQKVLHPQTGAWVTRTIRKFSPQGYGLGNSVWTSEFFLGDPNESPLIQPYRKITITRTANANGSESTREVTEDLNGNSYVITSDVSATYGFYKYGEPVKLSETKHTGTGSEFTTTWTYYTTAADQASFNKPATMRRSDGQWADYTYQGSPVTGILVTKTVSGWLDNSAPAANTAPDEAANRVVVEIEANNETGTFSREEKIQGVLVSKTWGERYKDNSGQIIEKSRVETGSATLTTLRTAFPSDAATPAAQRGRLKSVQNPDGTLKLHAYAFQGENRIETVDSGSGTLSGVTDGTRTVSTYTKDDILTKEVVSDITSGVVLSTKEAIAFDAYGEPSRWAYDNDPDDYSETLNGCCGIDSTRTRDGVVTTYTRDPLKRPKTATSQGITLTYTYGKKNIGGTDFPTENVTATAGGLTLDQGTTVRDLAGNVIQKISPDLDDDDNPEITTITRNFTTRTTTTENPDGGLVVETDFADGQSKATTGTATSPRFHTYSSHGELGGGELNSSAPTATGPWTRTYQNLAGRTLKTTFDDGTAEFALQTNSYDNLGRLVSSKDADNVASLIAYNSKGEAYRRAIDLNQNGQIDNNDRVTDTLQDVISNSPIGAALRSRSIIYDLSNNPVTVSTSYRTPDGLTTRQESLGVANSSTTTSPGPADRADGSWTDTSTAPDGTMTSITHQNWLPVTQSRLDTGGNVIESTTTGYDALRRPITQTHSRTGLVTTHYAASGQVASIDDHGHVTSFAYDSAGRRVSTTMPDNSVTHTTYWPTGQEKASYGSQTNPTVKLYTPEGQLHKLRTFRSANLALAPDENTSDYDETTWTYSSREQLERKQYADGKGTDYTYTPGGRLHTRTWARTVGGAPLVTTYGYNTAGELETTDYSDTTPDVTVLHDKLGRQQSVANGLATSTFTYDPTTLALDAETVSYDINRDGTPELTRVLDRSNDNLGRPTGFQLKNGTTIENEATYGYNVTDGRLQTVGGGATGSFSYGYLANSSLVDTITATAGAVHTTTNVWEPTRNVLASKQNKIGTNVVSQYDYTVNSIGQRTAVASSGTAFPALPSWLWGYDSLGQVTSADSSVNTNDRAYEYDSIGNRKRSADSLSLPGSDNYTANELNQYTAVGSLNPVHDFDGNATSYPLPAAPGNLSTLAWDAENRKISNTVGASTNTYLYDAQSRRIAKTTSAVTTLYLYDGFNCISEYIQSGTGVPPVLSKTRLWGTDLSGSMQGAGGVGGLLCESQILNSEVSNYFPTYDGNGNASEYLAANGTTTAHFEYDPFGNTVVATGTPELFTYRFSTKPLDFETGLYYYQYRYYDPVTGRWPSRDPIGEEGGLNMYGFGPNSPVNGIDSDGRVWQWIVNWFKGRVKKERRNSLVDELGGPYIPSHETLIEKESIGKCCGCESSGGVVWRTVDGSASCPEGFEFLTEVYRRTYGTTKGGYADEVDSIRIIPGSERTEDDQCPPSFL
jgi:RHS repeat-associated protein